MDSGTGLLAAAAAVRRLRPDADLVLSSDPDGLPWGPRTPDDVAARALAVARAAATHHPDALIVACNTASVHALPVLRAELEPVVPVIGTVPAIKPAAAGGGPVAIWATPATTGSPYQRDLVERFAHGVDVTGVPCPGLADAVEEADGRAIDAAVAAAARPHPAGRQGRRPGLHPLRAGRRTHPGGPAAARRPRPRPARFRGGRRRPGTAPHRGRARARGRAHRQRERAPQRPPGRHARRGARLRGGAAAGGERRRGRSGRGRDGPARLTSAGMSAPRGSGPRGHGAPRCRAVQRRVRCVP